MRLCYGRPDKPRFAMSSALESAQSCATTRDVSPGEDPAACRDRVHMPEPDGRVRSHTPHSLARRDHLVGSRTDSRSFPAAVTGFSWLKVTLPLSIPPRSHSRCPARETGGNQRNLGTTLVRH